MTTYDKVMEFQTTFKRFVGDTTHPKIDVPDRVLRWELIREEVVELFDALSKLDWVEVADALGDIEYVIEGAVITFGVNNLMDRADMTLDYAEMPIPEAVGCLMGLTLDLREAIGSFEETELIASILSEMYRLNRWIAFVTRDITKDLDQIIDAIHESNMSKLDENGEPILREGDNKILKGPNYFTPTAKIEEILGV